MYDDAEFEVGLDRQFPRTLEQTEYQGQPDQWPEGDGIEIIVPGLTMHSPCTN